MPSNRELFVNVRMNDEEALRLDTARRPKGLNRSAFIRMAMLEKLDRDGAPAKAPPQKKRRPPKRR